MMDEERPKRRADCKDGPRPCPWVACRYHLLVDVTKAGSISFPGGLRISVKQLTRNPEKREEQFLAKLETLSDTCALDLAERGPMTSQSIAGILGKTPKRVSQIEKTALRKVRNEFPEFEMFDYL